MGWLVGLVLLGLVLLLVGFVLVNYNALGTGPQCVRDARSPRSTSSSPGGTT